LAERVRGGPLRRGALELGSVTEEDLEEMAQAWEKWAATENATLGMLHGEILIEKPS
jgi:hypothetical protein